MVEDIQTQTQNEGGLTTAQLAGASDIPPSARTASPDELRLFPEDGAQELRRKWETVQGSFVDEPRRAVEEADALVAGAMKQLAEIFADERTTLERQWDRGDDVSTEDLRIAMQRYRTFFERLLTV